MPGSRNWASGHFQAYKLKKSLAHLPSKVGKWYIYRLKPVNSDFGGLTPTQGVAAVHQNLILAWLDTSDAPPALLFA